jgi:parallel beta-helix repeat protein
MKRPSRLIAPLFVAAFVLVLSHPLTARPTPTAGVNLSPTSFPGTYANIQAAIDAFGPGQRFNFACGIYRFPATGDIVLHPKAGDSFVGAGSISGVPNSPPCADFNGAIVISSWTSTTINGNRLWYNTVGSSNILSTGAGLQVGCMTPSGGFSGPAYLMWNSSIAKSSGANLIDSNGNTETAQNSGTTGSGNRPAWSTSLNGLTTDNDITWKLTALATPLPGRGCSFPQDLFYTPAGDTDIRHSVVKTHTVVWNAGNIGAGNWYIDFENVGGHGKFTVYVADDPTSSTVELTRIQQAILADGNASGVTIQNLTVEKFAAPNLLGTIEVEGANDVVENNWVTHSHGEGIELHQSSALNVVIDSNEVVEMGESGINTGSGNNTHVTNNRIERNNEDGTSYTYEAGGTKFAGDANTLIKGNMVLCNNGNGLWGDINDNGATYLANTISNNLLFGIVYEISHNGTIIQNTLTNNDQLNACQCIATHVPILNGNDVCTGPQTASGAGSTICQGRSEIGLYDSDVGSPPGTANGNTVVGGSALNGNMITSNCSGIRVTQDNRYQVTDDTITYNTLYLHPASGVLTTRIGGDNGGGFNLWGASPPTLFDYNTYHFDNSTSLNKQQWLWSPGTPGTAYTFSGWQGQGQDVHGSAATP